MEYIKFVAYGLGEDLEFHILNNNKEFLGAIQRIRIGQWMSWCLTSVQNDAYFSASCLDSIREKIKELNAQKNKKK